MKQSKSKWVSLICLTALSALPMSQTITVVQAETNHNQEQVKQEASTNEKDKVTSVKENQSNPVIAKTYTVKFHGNSHGSMGTMPDQTIELDKEEKLHTNTFTRKGHTFAGWSTQPSGGLDSQSYGDEATVKNIGTAGATINLYATWKSNTYTIKFHGNGGTDATPDKQMIYDQSDFLNENKSTRDGYEFIGWSTNPDGTGDTYTDTEEVYNLTDQPNGVINLYAIWKSFNQTISFDSDGGTTIAALNAKTGSQVNLDQYQPTKKGYILDGWLDEQGTVHKGEITVPSGGLKLKANWKANRYKVHFDANGGAGNMLDQEMTYDNITPLNANIYTRTGYKFIGWSTNPDGTGDTYTNTEEVQNLTDKSNETFNLYAIWSGHSYSITFNANNGTGSMDSLAMTYDIDKVLTANRFTRDGYEFAGWNTQADGTGTSYANETSVKNLTDVENGNVQLYAQWKKIPTPHKTISFDVNGGDESSKPMTINQEIGTTFNLDTLTKPTRMGYQFIGWYDNQGKEYKGKITIPDNDLTLKAGWKVMSYKVTYQSNDGSPVSFSKVDFDTLIKEPETPTRMGYSFKGWYRDVDLKTEWHFGQDKMPAKDLTLYAKWKNNRDNNGDIEEEKEQNPETSNMTPNNKHSQNQSSNQSLKQAQTKSNQKKQILPTTGSEATPLMTTIGSSILGLVALAFVSRRRRDKKSNKL